MRSERLTLSEVMSFNSYTSDKVVIFFERMIVSGWMFDVGSCSSAIVFVS